MVLKVTVYGGNHLAAIDREGICSGIRRVIVRFEEGCGNLKGLEHSLEGKKMPSIPFAKYVSS